MNQYSHERRETAPARRTKRIVVAIPDRTPAAEEQPSLFDPPQGATQGLTNREKWEAWKQANPLVYRRIWALAEAEAAAGAKRISVNRLFEQIRAEGLRHADPNSEWAINDHYRAPCADDLCADARLAKLIERRKRQMD